MGLDPRCSEVFKELSLQVFPKQLRHVSGLNICCQYLHINWQCKCRVFVVCLLHILCHLHVVFMYTCLWQSICKQLCVCSCLRVCLSAIWFILVVFVNCKKFCWHELSLAANIILAGSVINRVNYPFYGSSQNNHDLCIPEFSFSISCFRPIFKRQTRILGRFLTKGHKVMKI